MSEKIVQTAGRESLGEFAPMFAHLNYPCNDVCRMVERMGCVPIGAPNDAFAKFFIGQSYLAPISTEQVPIFNVTFEPGCRNNWHIHKAKTGGGQMLICVGGRGYY